MGPLAGYIKYVPREGKQKTRPRLKRIKITFAALFRGVLF
jgi:hypothetical protein